MSKYIGLAKKAAPDKKIIVYCWRGGKRSGSLSWLFDLAGFDVKTIQGGYKNYRKNAQQSLDNQTFNFVRIGGKTGTGKTEILHQLREKGEQILDLEALANHKGSAFGELGELPQPSNEQFENLIFHELNKLDFSKKIWLENESRGIGKIFMPEWFWNHFTTTPLINVEIPHALRVKRLVVDYAAFPKEVLIQKFTTIERKIGGNNLKVAVEAIEKNDFETAAEIALFWYDKTYTFGLGKKYNTEVKSLKFDHADISKIADTLIL